MRFILALLTIFTTNISMASLGGDLNSVRAASESLNTTIATIATTVTKKPTYTLHETSLTHLQLREFANSSGKVFAVAWSGRSHLDPAIAMGDHLTDFQAALAEAKRTHFGHGPLSIERNGFHLELSGNSLALRGRAWLTQDLPARFDKNEIR
jgi:hypothetical protein